MQSTKKVPLLKFYFLALAVLAPAFSALALDGSIGIHDPSTLLQCDGKWYTWGTGGTALESDDGWTWRAGTRCPAGGAAPDVIHVGDKYFQYISHGTFLWTKSLNPNSPDYGWKVEVDRGMFGYEYTGDFINPIDPGAFYDTKTNKLWLTYGSYLGFTRVIELDPKTGLRVDKTYHNIGINLEATTMIYHDGWYYLLGTHGSCCAGSSSGYNIRVGRSKNVTGPFVDQTGLDMMEGGGKLVCGSGGRNIGPGHFGLIDEGEDVQKFSLHWEQDLDRSGGFGYLGVLPLLWKDGWPVAGELFKAGTYNIESERTGTSLELAVEGVPVGGGRGGRGGGGGGAPGGRGGMMGGGRGGVPGAAAGGVPGAAMAAAADSNGTGGRRAGRGAGGTRGGMMGGGMMGGRGGGGSPVPDQNAAQVSANWPEGNVDVRLSNYMCQAQQKWTITPAEGKGGVLGSPYFKITIAGTDRTLAATEDGELIALAKYTGSDEQLWRIEQFTDGTWRVKPKAIPNSKDSLCLSAIGQSFATLAKFDPNSDKQRWLFKTP